MRRWAPFGLLALAAAAAPDPGVYTCHVPVTGYGVRNRPEAVAACLRQVLVKLSGDADVAGKPLPPGAAVTDFAYLDLMTDIPLHDEQGTRDRPFEFVGRVDSGWAETAVLMDNAVPWTAPRPVLRVTVAVTDMKGNRFALTGDGERGERQRRALLDASELFALPVSLPVSLPAEGEAAAPPSPVRSPVLAGTLRWSDADFGWVAEWRMGTEAWSVRGVSFDAAFRAGVGGAARRLAAAAGQSR